MMSFAMSLFRTEVFLRLMSKVRLASVPLFVFLHLGQEFLQHQSLRLGLVGGAVVMVAMRWKSLLRILWRRSAGSIIGG